MRRPTSDVPCRQEGQPAPGWFRPGPMRALALASSLFAVAGCAEGDAHAESVTVRVAQGTLRGRQEGPVAVYRGVPYAVPPVGARRFRAPEPLPRAEQIIDASRFGARCVQRELEGRKVIGSEDCLTLNVWTPSPAPAPAAPSLPVLVWLHGGANRVGSSAEKQYDGRLLAERGAVVVSLNYRLGPFGFLAHPAFASEGTGSTGNYALLDQIEALTWVRDNVAAFGGDPRKVLLFGQSAGADNACALLASPRAAGLFQRVLLMSAGCRPVEPEAAERTWRGVAAELGCARAAEAAACLRAAPADALAKVEGAGLEPGLGGWEFYYTVDGAVLPQAPLDAFRAGSVPKLPVVVSTTADEFTTLLDLAVGGKIETHRDLVAALDAFLDPAVRDLLLTHYPEREYGSPRATLVAILGDASYHCPSRRVARALRDRGLPVYRSLFGYVFPDAKAARFGAGHGFDTGFLFGVYDAPIDDAGRELTDLMTGLALDLARVGSPFASDPSRWPVYGPTDPYIRLDRQVSHGLDWRGRQCDLWDALESAR